jgi:ATP-dependent helicase HrpA
VISYPPELPVSAAREEIARAISEHQVVIVAGATGSGKTTQLPKICLELGRTSIAHTQPRRIAARTIAERISEEMQVPLGGTVGYKVRFTDKVSSDTRVALVTDGILLNEIHRDRLLRRYDTIIIDEAHERSLNIDFLLGYLRRLLPRRPDLKVIVTSATIDPGSFARHFADAAGNPAPVIEVSGRTYPVDIRYRPFGTQDDTDDSPENTGTAAPPRASVLSSELPDGEDEVSAIVSALRELDTEAPGDVLVFLPGEAEIRDAMDAVRGAYAKDAAPTEVLPLYGRLSAAEQHRVFERSTVAGVRRRVILATNVAETSLTVPGIRYVVDSGTARISRYSNRSKIQRLPIEAVSQASAQQRAGRAGRTAPGIAIRLYAEDDFLRRPEFTEPEILRTSLASVILQMLALGFGDISSFPFLTPPDSRGVSAAFELLTELGAIRRDRDGVHLTKVGRELARLPIDPRFARMLVEAERTGVQRDVLAIVAGLSIQDVRERPEEQREQAQAAHARFTDPSSDFLSVLNLWNHLREQQAELGSSAFRRLCRAEFLNYVRVREWFDVHRQLSQLVGAPRNPDPGTTDPDTVHRAILAGLLSQIGVLDERARNAAKGKTAKSGSTRAEYRGARGARFSLFPGSGLRKKSPQAVMAAELVETSRLYARTAAAIDPAWAEDLAGDLAKRQLSDPHWSKDAGAAVAAEKVTLFGVEIIPRRRVQLARFDRPLAREMFIRHALVDEEWDAASLSKPLTAFARRNLELRRRLEKVEERERRRDILAGDEAVFAFYEARIPADVFDVRSFVAWWKDASATTPRLLDLREADLLEGSSRADERDFPTRWRQGDQVLSLAYRFEPGAPDDGVTVVVPVALLAQLRPDGFDWQVPGMRDDLIAGLIRALPKAIRRHVVPAADWAARFSEDLAELGPENSAGLPRASLREALAARIQRIASQPVTADDFDLERLPSHLLMSFRAVDHRGRTIGSDRDLTALQTRLAERAQTEVSRTLERKEQAPHRPGPAAPAATAGIQQRSELTDWTFSDLPELVDTAVAGGVVRGYPALIDTGSDVTLRIEATPEAAAAATRDGLRRLVLLSSPSPASYVLEHLTANEKLALAASPYQNAKALIEDARGAVADAVIARTAPGGNVRDRAGFEAVRDAFSAAVTDELFATVSLVSRILIAARDVERELKRQNSLILLGALNDVRGQLGGLVHPGFVSRTGLTRLTHLPRYLRGALERVRTLPDNPGRDRQRMTEYERVAVAFAEAGGVIPPAPGTPARIVHARWLLEEFRVSLYAQQLGTAEPVSAQRIVKALRGERASG